MQIQISKGSKVDFIETIIPDTWGLVVDGSHVGFISHDDYLMLKEKLVVPANPPRA